MTAEREAMTLERELRAHVAGMQCAIDNCGMSPKEWDTSAKYAMDNIGEWKRLLSEYAANLSRVPEPVAKARVSERAGEVCWELYNDKPLENLPAGNYKLYLHPPEPADAATKALAALGHVRKPNDRCTARYAEVPKKDRPPGPANAPVWCCLRAGHDGPHKCSHYGMHPPFMMRPDQTVMGDPLPDVCSKCGTRWPCPDAASVIAAMAQESGE